MGYSFSTRSDNASKDNVTAIKFSVNLDHLTEGEPCEPTLCPIALALSDLGFYHVTVEHEIICYCLTDSSEERLVHVAPDIIDWQRDFDLNKDPGPIDLVLLQHTDLGQGDRLISLNDFQQLGLDKEFA